MRPNLPDSSQCGKRGADKGGFLAAGRGFQTGVEIRAVGAASGDGFRDVGGSQASGQQPGARRIQSGEGGGVQPHAVSAAVRSRIEQKESGMVSSCLR